MSEHPDSIEVVSPRRRGVRASVITLLVADCLLARLGIARQKQVEDLRAQYRSSVLEIERLQKVGR